jgi:general secretion pathway protein D
MRLIQQIGFVLILCAAAMSAYGQAPPKMTGTEPVPPSPPFQPIPQQQNPQQPQPGQPNAAAPQQAAPGAAAPGGRISSTSPFQLGGVSLKEMIDIIAKELKINYILDPRVDGKVTIYTYGEVKPVDLMNLLETILRVNGATIVKVGEFYRVVPIAAISALPLPPQINADQKTLPDDERMILNMVFLKYATATEMDKLLSPFYGEGASHSAYEPANLLILQDNARNMKRTMDLLALFDSDTFAKQRVRLFDVEHAVPSDLAKELENVFKAYALSDKTSVKFLPVDRINVLIAVAPNPGIFEEVKKWMDKLDVPVKITAGAVNNYVYRLKYGRAETIAMAIMALYSGNPFALSMAAMMGNMGGGMGGGMMGYGGGMGYPGGMGSMGYGMGAYGAMGMGGFPGMGYGGYGMGGLGMNPYGMGGYGMNPYGMYGGSPGAMQGYAGGIAPAAPATGAPGAAGTNRDQTGSYLSGGAGANAAPPRIPHVIPNPFDNTLLIQANAQEYEQIASLLRQLDVAPRQVLIDAKIYELELTGAFSSGVQAYLQKRGTAGLQNPEGGSVATRSLTMASNGGAAMSVGALVLRSHELLLAVSAAESQHKSRVIAAPSIIATDSVPATMNVGQDVPVLTSSGIAVTGSSFNSVSNRSTGTTLSIVARVNASGIITLIIDQDVSNQVSQTSGAIGSPTFASKRFSTQVTVQDGDTIAIGGFIGEANTSDTAGVPILSRIPILGGAFGSKQLSRSRSELVVFLTPRVIYDASQVQDATDEIKSNLKKLRKSLPE